MQCMHCLTDSRHACFICLSPEQEYLSTAALETDRQRTCNVALRHVRVTIVAVEKQQL